MPAQVHQTDQSTPVRRELAAAVTLAGDDEQRVETSNTSLNGTGALSVANAYVVTRSVAMLKSLTDPVSADRDVAAPYRDGSGQPLPACALSVMGRRFGCACGFRTGAAPADAFAPVVLEHLAPDVFELGKKKSSPYMTFVVPVRPEYQDMIQGACHVDGTSRIQTVTELTGIPCLINTSFNVAGDPIVCSPADALSCFLKTEMDHLFLGNFLVPRDASE